MDCIFTPGVKSRTYALCGREGGKMVYIMLQRQVRIADITAFPACRFCVCALFRNNQNFVSTPMGFFPSTCGRYWKNDSVMKSSIVMQLEIGEGSDGSLALQPQFSEPEYIPLQSNPSLP